MKVRAEGVSKRWHGAAGLAPLTFAMGAGELVVVVGRSGSGKSTLLSLLAGWCAPDEGTLEIDGRTPSAAATATWSEIALVPQSMALQPELTARENVRDVAPGGTDAELTALLDRLGLTPVQDRFPAEMSLGQQQRVAVARAVFAHPTVLLADEPTSHQDSDHAAVVAEVLREAAAAGAAVLAVTHDLALAAHAARVLELESDT